MGTANTAEEGSSSGLTGRQQTLAGASQEIHVCIAEAQMSGHGQEAGATKAAAMTPSSQRETNRLTSPMQSLGGGEFLLWTHFVVRCQAWMKAMTIVLLCSLFFTAFCFARAPARGMMRLQSTMYDELLRLR